MLKFYNDARSIKSKEFLTCLNCLPTIIFAALFPMAEKSVDTTVMPRSSLKTVSLKETIPTSSPCCRSVVRIFLISSARSISVRVMKHLPLAISTWLISVNSSKFFSKRSQNFYTPEVISAGWWLFSGKTTVMLVYLENNPAFFFMA